MLQWLLLVSGVNPGLVSGIMIGVGLAVISGAVYLLVKQTETRLVLLGSGFLLCALSLEPLEAFIAFEKGMVLSNLIKAILSVMGFAYVMKFTKCDAHLVNLMVGMLSRVRFLLIPGAVLGTTFINISLPTAAGCSAAVGTILIPIMVSLGIHPAVAATAVIAGTSGSLLSPGLSQNAFIANMLEWDVMQVLAVHIHVDVIAYLIGAVVLTIIAVLRREHKGYVPDAEHSVEKVEKVNLCFALVPILPVVLLACSAWFSSPNSPAFGKSIIEAAPWLKSFTSVPVSMLTGTIVGIAITRANPTACVKEFFTGMGNSYGSIMGIIIAAGVFVAGMHAVGLVAAGIDLLKQATDMAKWAAAFGPFILAIITGSGDAATLAFNQAVSPHAVDFGMTVENMASLSMICGSLGRAVSPLAGAAIICAGIARVNPLEITKRNAPGMVIAAFVSMLLLA